MRSGSSRHRSSRSAGADSGAPAVGSVELGPPRVDGRPLTDYGGWLGTVGADRLQRDGALRFHVTLTNEVETDLRPRQPTDGLQIPAVVSPFLATLAGPDRVLGVTVNGEQLAVPRGRGRAALPRRPQNVSSDFLVADRPALESALNTSTPGSGFATELWLDTQSRGARRSRLACGKLPFTALAVSSRSQLEHSLRAEPIARAAVAMLETAALTAIVLALLGLVLGAVSERRDGPPSCSTSRPRAWHPRACGASFACGVAGRAGRSGRRRGSPGSCSRCSSFGSSN